MNLARMPPDAFRRARVVIVREPLTRANLLGGAEGTRTPDPHTASVVRYQLRHGPKARSPGHRAIVHRRARRVTSRVDKIS
jgi:hypothetical protein